MMTKKKYYKHDNDNMYNRNIIKLRTILNKKRKHFENEIKSKRFDSDTTKCNKFVSDLGESEDTKNFKKFNDWPTYSYSFPFNYWKHCQHDSSDFLMYKHGHKLGSVFVDCAYSNVLKKAFT